MHARCLSKHVCTVPLDVCMHGALNHGAGEDTAEANTFHCACPLLRANTWPGALNHGARENTRLFLQLEGTARYAGLLLAPAKGYGLRPRFFCPSGKNGLFMLFLLILGLFGVQ